MTFLVLPTEWNGISNWTESQGCNPFPFFFSFSFLPLPFGPKSPSFSYAEEHKLYAWSSAVDNLRRYAHVDNGTSPTAIKIHQRQQPSSMRQASIGDHHQVEEWLTTCFTKRVKQVWNKISWKNKPPTSINRSTLLPDWKKIQQKYGIPKLSSHSKQSIACTMVLVNCTNILHCLDNYHTELWCYFMCTTQSIFSTTSR
jgi:hypothetical protein